MKSIVLVDFPDKWPSLLPQLTQSLQSQVCQPSCNQMMAYTDLVSLTLHLEYAVMCQRDSATSAV